MVRCSTWLWWGWLKPNYSPQDEALGFGECMKRINVFTTIRMFTSRYSTWFHQNPLCTHQGRLHRLSCAHVITIMGRKNVITIIGGKNVITIMGDKNVTKIKSWWDQFQSWLKWSRWWWWWCSRWWWRWWRTCRCTRPSSSDHMFGSYRCGCLHFCMYHVLVKCILCVVVCVTVYTMCGTVVVFKMCNRCFSDMIILLQWMWCIRFIGSRWCPKIGYDQVSTDFLNLALMQNRMRDFKPEWTL